MTSFKLETEVLEKLLLKDDVGDKKIVVISVTGKVHTVNKLFKITQGFESDGVEFESDYLIGRQGG